MIRTLAAIAALAALPTLAAAQGPNDSSGLTVPATGPASAYAVTIDIAGKAPSVVRNEIWDAAEAACQRAPMTDNRADFPAETWLTCVNQAAYQASVQYDRILKGQ
jgi:hypothetical protein